jgi:hypothetical protein
MYAGLICALVLSILALFFVFLIACKFIDRDRILRAYLEQTNQLDKFAKWQRTQVIIT